MTWKLKHDNIYNKIRIIIYYKNISLVDKEDILGIILL